MTDELPAFSRADGAGYVYCLSNPAMPGLVKIGHTKRTTQVRINELSFGYGEYKATGVPLPFELVKEWRVPWDKSEEIEKQIHAELDKYRVPAHGGRLAKEFFYLEPAEAITNVENALRKMDWWTATQAQSHDLQKETLARQQRVLVRQRQQREAERLKAAAKKEVDDKKQALITAAYVALSGKGKMAGFKWASIWFIGSAIIFFGLMEAKDPAIWFCVILAVFAYFMTNESPARDYVASPGFQSQLAAIESEVNAKYGLEVESVEFR